MTRSCGTGRASAGKLSNAARSAAKSQAPDSATQHTPAVDLTGEDEPPGLPSTSCPPAETQPTPEPGATDGSPAGQTASPEHEDIDEDAVDEEAEAIREANIKAMLSNNVKTERTAVMPKFLMVRQTPNLVYKM